MKDYDIAVIGGGHNALVCAAYLARAGKRVAVLEARARVGGAADTRELHDGFRVSGCAHLLHSLDERVVDDLALDRRGLGFSATSMATTVLCEQGNPLTLAPGARARREALLSHSLSDADRLEAFQRRLDRFAAVMAPLLTTVPPRLGTDDWADRAALVKLAWRARRLGRKDLRELLRVLGMNVADLVEDSLESDRLRAAYAFDAVLGTHLGPRSPGSVLTLLYRLMGRSRTGLSHPQGGMGTLAAALAEAARAEGVEIRTASPVARVLVEDDRAAGVELETGERVRARVVVSGADPKRTFLRLVGVEHLDTGFVRRVSNIRMRGNAAKLHLALKGLPEFKGLADSDLAGRLLIVPGVDYLERAFNHAKYGEYSAAPAMEITLPSVHDPSLAPEGRHVLSAIVQYVPYKLAGGWEKGAKKLEKLLLDTLARYAPSIKRLVLAAELLAPPDLEAEYGMTGGHWHHGELAFDQFLMLRPVHGAAQYDTPVPGLYLCGAGSHPGGGVTGAVGYTAAHRIIAREIGE